MSWKCICLTDNDADANICKSCKKERPVYKKINIDFPITESSQEEIAKYYLNIADDFIERGQRQKDLIVESFDKSDREKLALADIGFSHFEMAFKLIDIVESLINQATEEMFDVDFLNRATLTKYHCHFYKAFLNNIIQHHSEALEEYYKAYDVFPFQDALYFMAISIIDIPLENIPGFIIGEKMKIAQQQKMDIEIDLLIKSISMDPTSECAKDAGIMLIEKYKITEVPFSLGKKEITITSQSPKHKTR